MATLTETFTNIADAIRSKTETTDKITPENMPAMIEGITTGGNVAELSITSNGTYRAPEGIDGYTPVIVNVPQDGSPPAEAFVLTGEGKYKFSYNGWNWFIKQYGNQITSNDITSVEFMFYYTDKLEEIPFEINVKNNKEISMGNMFYKCEKLKNVPAIKNVKPYYTNSLFDCCYNLREIPEDYCDTWDWSYIDNITSAYNNNQSGMFQQCNSLRKIPKELISHANNYSYSGYSLYSNAFIGCNVLDEIVDLAVLAETGWTSNGFSSSIYNGTFFGCNRLKRLTFATNEDGTPKVAKWTNQTIDLASASNGARIGYCYDGETSILKYNSGITADKKVYNDETYQALKDDPDWWTENSYYSRYNKTSAIETINSLPDTSAYIAQKGGTNTIKFGINNGLYTDGGAINTMTEEEIAVAAAKGWTVSFG